MPNLKPTEAWGEGAMTTLPLIRCPQCSPPLAAALELFDIATPAVQVAWLYGLIEGALIGGIAVAGVVVWVAV